MDSTLNFQKQLALKINNDHVLLASERRANRGKNLSLYKTSSNQNSLAQQFLFRKKMQTTTSTRFLCVLLVATWSVVVMMMTNILNENSFVNGDLPVHCLYNTTLGVWEFSLTAQNMNANDVMAQCDLRAKINPVSTMLISLQMPDVAIDQKGNRGFWTLVYDQGFEVVIGENKYWAFFNFTTSGKGEFVNYFVEYCSPP